MMRFAILFLLAATAYGQQTHSVTLGWGHPTPDNPPGTTYRFYWAPGPCNPLPTTWSLAVQDLPASVVVWQHTTGIVPGVRCYSGTAYYNSLESVKSVPAETSVPSFVPTGLVATVVANQVQLTWADDLNPPGTTRWKVLRAPGLCSGSPVFSPIATALAVKNYTDAAAPVGTSCYAVTATDNGVESSPSNGQQAAIPTLPPTALTIQQVQ